MRRLLWTLSDNARLCLIAGLVAGLALPETAAALQPWLPEMVAGLLFVTALRLGHGAVLGALGHLRTTLFAVLGLQFVLPLALLALLTWLGQAQTPWALAMVLATGAPAISGASNLALLLRQDAGAMMRIMVLGTAAFPLTVLPLLALMPQLGPAEQVAMASLRLLGVIVVATGAGFVLRALVFPGARVPQIKALDGLSVLAFSGIVVGLMAALNPALRTDPGQVALWALFAFGLGYGLQVSMYIAAGAMPLRGPIAIAAGNRNIALFLVALPPEVIAPLMVFVGCWQLPMYLTPLLLRRLYAPQEALHE